MAVIYSRHHKIGLLEIIFILAEDGVTVESMFQLAPNIVFGTLEQLILSLVQEIFSS